MAGRLHYFHVLVLCCLNFFSANAQDITLTDKNEVYQLNASTLRWAIDSSGERDPSKLNFKALTAKQLSEGETSWSTWTRFTLKNNTGSDQDVVLQIPKSGRATAWIQSDGGSVELKTGSLLPLNERSLKASVNGFRILIGKNEQLSVLLRLQSVYSIYVPRNYDISVVSQVKFAGRDNQRILWQGIFLGIILVMVLYNLLIGIAVKDTSYLYYVLSIVGIGTYFAFYYGFGIEYIWPRAPLWDTYCYLIIVPFSGLTRLLFTRTYLHTPRLLPRTNRIMNIFMGVSVVILTMGMLAYIFRWDIIMLLIEIIGFTGTSIHLLMLIAGIIAFTSERYMPAKYFIWANIVLVLGAVLFIGRELGLLNDNFMTRYLVQIGFMIQVVVFSLGLASRLNEMRNQLTVELLEKERLALEREREKKALIESQKKELLLQVEQQTKDLKEKNAALERSFAMVKESEHQLARMNQVKNKLFSVISHDLRNPLATMQSFLKLVTEHQHRLTEEEKQQLFLQAQQSLDNLNLLLYNLLQWSRSQMNLLEIKPEKLQVRSILDNCTKVLQLNAHMKNVSVRVQTDDNFWGYADKEMTEFVVRNLISNAIKFSYRDKEVLVKAYRLNGDVVIEVKDWGIGMTDSKIRKLMETNTSISRRGTEKEKGTGLGLLISKEFIEKNKGTLSISSEPGKGTSFSFTIQAVN